MITNKSNGGLTMTQYINKAAVEKILRNLWKTNDENNSDRHIYYNKALQKVQCELDTLEVKEVDLEKEIEDYIYQLPHSATGACANGINVKDTLARKYGVVHAWHFEDVYTIARHFYELGMKSKNTQSENVTKIKWKPCTEIPTEHWENNPAISPLYLVKCGSVNGNPILGYTHYSYASNSWMECFHATERGMWNVLEWTDERNI